MMPIPQHHFEHIELPATGWDHVRKAMMYLGGAFVALLALFGAATLVLVIASFQSGVVS